MVEGLRRLQRIGAVVAFVGSWEPVAHALYASVGFTDTTHPGPGTTLREV
jgi:hypothetical protein